MINRQYFYIWTLAVDVDKKSKGIGTALVQQVIDDANARKLLFTLKRIRREM
jgi:ribosomal protein S18 acetylase RimI-like enzyme